MEVKAKELLAGMRVYKWVSMAHIKKSSGKLKVPTADFEQPHAAEAGVCGSVPECSWEPK